jgi:hypothetical protein
MTFTIAYLLGVATPIIAILAGLLIARILSINEYETDDDEMRGTL